MPGEAPDAVAPPPHHRRFPLLDGMRAIAVLCVMLVHIAFFAQGNGSIPGDRLLLHLNLGVTIFFLISGFLLYRPFIAHRSGGSPAPPIAQYAKRRALRIFPAYWLALTVLTLVPGLVGVSGGEWLSQYGLLHTIELTDNPASCVELLYDCGLAQTWSLVIELTFYVTLPLWFLLSERLSRGRSLRGWVTIELAILAALSAISVALHFSGSGPSTSAAFSGTLAGYVLWFALGMGLAIASVALEARTARPRAIQLVARHPGAFWLAALAIYLFLALELLPVTPFLFDRNPALNGHLGFGLIALLLMLPAVFADDSGGLPRRLLANPVVAWIGLVSYGIFLWHYAVILELSDSGEGGLTFWPLLVATLAITIAIAALSYYALERPLLRFKRQ